MNITIKVINKKHLGVLDSTIDDLPSAYKPIESILENIKDTVEVIKGIKII